MLCVNLLTEKKNLLIGPSLIVLAMFIAALLTAAKKWKWSNCPLTDERIMNASCISTVKLYSSVLKKWNQE